MPKIKDKIAVTVTENNSDAGLRRITVEIEAAAALLTISDLLAREDALEALPQQLKRATKTLITDYIRSGKLLLKRAAQSAAGEPREKPGTMPKPATWETRP